MNVGSKKKSLIINSILVNTVALDQTRLQGYYESDGIFESHPSRTTTEESPAEARLFIGNRDLGSGCLTPIPSPL